MPLRRLAAVLLTLALLPLAAPQPRAQNALSASEDTASVENAAARDTVVLGLEGAIQRALEVSPEVGQEEAQRAFAEARADFALANRYLTEFTATTGHAVAPGISNPNDTPEDRLYLDPDVRNEWDKVRPYNEIEIEVLQPIYTWGELSGNIRAARAGVLVEDAAVRAKADEVAARTGELYYNVLLTEALYRLAAEAESVVDRATRELTELLESGDPAIDNADLFQTRITAQEIRGQLIEVEQLRATAQVALARQLFLPEGTVVRPEDLQLEALEVALAPLETYTATALMQRPELAQARAGLAAREALVDVAKSGYYPKLFVGGTFRRGGAVGRIRQPNAFIGDGYRSNALRAGLGLRMELNVAQTRAQVEQAKAEREEVRHQQTAAQQLVLFEVEQAYRDVLITQAALVARDSSLLLAREWLRTEQIDFDLGLSETENLVEAVRATLELQAAALEAAQRYNAALLRLWRATGTLSERALAGTLREDER
jgi:outer membrane protein TolC